VSRRLADRGSVQIVSLGDGNAKELVTLPDGIILSSWAPDGKRILFWSDPSFSESLVADGADLYTVTVPQGEVRSLGVRTLPDVDFDEFSPDGKYLALTEGDGRETWTHKRIALLDLSNGTKTFLTSENVAALSPSSSPTGRSIAFSAGPDEDASVREGPSATLGHAHIWVMRPDGSESRQLTFDPAYRDERPRWSEDGREIVFGRVNAAGEGSLWRMDEGVSL
jgi:Tol biopolymer transport system component